LNHIDTDEFEDCLELARTLLGGGDDDEDLWEANEQVNHALGLRPEHGEAWVLKAQVLSSLGDDAAAYAAIELGLRLEPENAEAHYVRAAVLGDLERYDEALEELEHAFRWLTPGDDWLVEDLYYEKSALLESAGRADEAVAVLEAGLRRFPDSAMLRAGIEPLRRAKVRHMLRVLPGGRA
jgi:tetratricopeptide (TPR) repeat protein